MIMRLIPAIDLKDGRCVRLLKGRFDQATLYPTDALSLQSKYRELGADWLHVVDLDGARLGTAGNRDIIFKLLEAQALKIQVGGGLRNTAAVAAMLNAGVSRVVIGSIAIMDADLVKQWLDQFGADRIALAFDVNMDANATPFVATHGWQLASSITLWNALAPYAQCGLRHVLCTDIGRDGAFNGPNLELYREALRRHPRIEWQASGGVRDARDLESLAAIGTAAAISGKALLEERITREELRPFLPNA
jgi:phosphoribosylformimino-5-aminoimidazole carboxamide ribotide isomerase